MSLLLVYWCGLNREKQEQRTYMIVWYHSVSNPLPTLWNIKVCTMPTTPNPILSFSDFVISFRRIQKAQISLCFALRPTYFWVTSHFVTSAQYNPKRTLNITRSKVPYTMYVSSVPNINPFWIRASWFGVTAISKPAQWMTKHWSSILWSDDIEIQSILKQVHGMTSNDLEH